MTAEQDRQGLVEGLRALGVRTGQDLLVHSSLRKFGPVQGGVETVFEALRLAAGCDSTIIVPTHTAGNSLSSPAFRAATAGLGPDQLAEYVAAIPGFDPLTTPSEGMGTLAEYVRTSPGAVRSSHPQTSFAALGPRAAECTNGHILDCHLGERSPLGWLYRAGGAVLLLGVGYPACTALHLAEYRLPTLRYRGYRCFTMDEGGRRERDFGDIDLMDSDFGAVGRRMDHETFVYRGRVGGAYCRLLQVWDAVDFAVAWTPFRRRRAAT